MACKRLQADGQYQLETDEKGPLQTQRAQNNMGREHLTHNAFHGVAAFATRDAGKRSVDNVVDHRNQQIEK